MMIVVIAIIGWAISPAILRLAYPAPGDGKTIESYAFNLSELRMSQELIVPAMQHRDMSPVLTDPSLLSVEELAKKNETKRSPFLVPSDLVVGVTIEGESRVYPLHVLNVHEIINDTIQGVPILVYWNWPSGNVAVYERVVHNETIEFGMSGLSGNGSMLLYENQQEEGGEQLYSMILGESISGIAKTLAPIPHEVTSWESWLERHPDTKSLAPDEDFKKRYRKGDPRTYFLNDTIYFPVQPMPSDETHPKAPVIAVQTNGGYEVFSIQSLYDNAIDGTVKVKVGEETLVFHVDTPPLYATVHDLQGNLLPSQRALWFTWFANHPETTINTVTDR